MQSQPSLEPVGNGTPGYRGIVEPLIRATDLARAYGAIEALRGVSFEILPGEIVGLLGPNGAGKTTAMKVLTGWLAPTRGRVEVCGYDVLLDPVGVRREVGYLPEGAPAHPEQTVLGWLRFAAEVRGLGRAERARAIDRVVADCGLADRLGQRIETLSRGYRQRVGLAQALLHQPRVLILDEPTTGLDPNQVVEIRALIRAVGQQRTVILSTHVLSEVQATCDRVLILHEGRLVADDRVEDLAEAGEGQTLRLSIGAGKVVCAPEELAASLRRIEAIEAVHVEAPGAGTTRLSVRARADVREAVYRWAVDGGHVLVELAVEQRSLEEAFRHLTGSSRGSSERENEGSEGRIP